MKALDQNIVDFVRQAVQSDAFARYLQETLVTLVNFNTAPGQPLSDTVGRERRFFDWLESEIARVAGPACQVERPAINPAIGGDEDYSLPGYAADAAGKVPPAEVVYAGRHNLYASIPSPASPTPGVLLHAHVDVVPPWKPARAESGRVYGRGACDNKAQVAVLLAQMKLLREVEEKFGKPAAGRVYQFVIDEEIGGNGSLSAALDPRFAGLPVLMHESTDLVPYCAHRGCVYYRCRLSIGRNTGMTAVELFPFVVLALEAEGRKFKRETMEPGFTAAHVQTSHGKLGPFGEHAGSVCDRLDVEVIARTNANPERLALKLTQFLDEAAAEYINRYGDKTREVDPTTGKPKLARHFDAKVVPCKDGQRIRIDVYGISGHMGAVAECDGAITKAALLFAGLIKAAAKFPGVDAFARLWTGEETTAIPAGAHPQDAAVVLEGGQGFTPSHRMADVQARMTAAARNAVKKYCQLRGRKYDDSMVEMSFDRLHNDAYAASPEIAPMQALRAACAAVGRSLGQPAAWETSCDARIYHHHGHPVAIFGAGKLNLAHSDGEYVDMADVQTALAVSTLATWAMLG